jgi:8-oxo-dGTP pyrophosphatase MutT (NUDIX family)
MKKCSHQIVAALIRNAEGDVLLFRRNTPPPGFAGPAGHCEAGERFEEALAKEVREEVGLHVIEYRLIAEFFDPHPCRREDTEPGHDWKCYEVTVSGALQTNDREVVPQSARYFAPHELAEIAARTEAGKPNVDGFDWPWLRFFRVIGLVKNPEGGV